MRVILNRAVAAACAVTLVVGLVPQPAFVALASAEPATAKANVQAATTPASTADYVIEDQADFKAFRDDVNAGKTTASTTAVLASDIYVSFSSSDLPVGTVDENAGGSTNSSPESAHPFKGTFDGQNHSVMLSIGNMYSSGAKTFPAAALFGVVEGGTVKNLVVEGRVEGTGTSSTGSINGAAAGAVGILLGGTVENVVNCADIAGGNATDTCASAGGIVGFGWGAVRNCANHGDISKQNGWSAGIVGRCDTGAAGKRVTTIENCYNTGTVSGDGYALSSYYYRHAGIACSFAQGNASSEINLSNCYNAGAITQGYGGFTEAILANNGIVDKTSGTVTNCYWASDKADTAGTDVEATAMTSSNMEAASFPVSLGSAFVQSKLPDQATPMLAWEGDLEIAYFISSAQAAGGKVSFYVDGQPVTRAPAGSQVSIVVAPDQGYELGALSVKDASGSVIAATDNMFTMPEANVMVTPAFSKVDGDKLDFSIVMRDSDATEFELGQRLGAHKDLAIQLADVEKASYSLGAADKGDVANFTLEWFSKAEGESDFTAIPGTSGTVKWNSVMDTVLTVGDSIPYRYSASIADAGTTVYQCRGTWTLAGYKMATASSPEITITVTPGVTDVVSSVSSTDDFDTLRASLKTGVSYSGRTVSLANDIALGSGWQPIGTDESPFNGTFDGNGHTITFNGAKAEFGTPYDTAFGLFGYTSGATVRDFTVTGSLESDAGMMGAVVAEGSASSPTRVQDVRNLASVKSNAEPTSPGSYGCDCAVGGVVGAGAFTLFRCANKGTVTSSNPFVATGGVAGAVQYSSSIESCYNLGAVSNTAAWSEGYTYQLWVGGIACAGVAGSATITKCYNAGKVSAPAAEEGQDVEVAAVLGGSTTAASAPVVSLCYYLADSADRGFGPVAMGRKGTEAPTALSSRELLYLYAQLGSNWQHGGAANASAGKYPALAWEEEYALPTFTVTFDANGGSSVESASVKEGYSVAASPSTTRSGYVFEGWYSGADRVRFPYTPTVSATLKAQWSCSVATLSSAISQAEAELAKEGAWFVVAESDDVDAAKAEVAKRRGFVTALQLAAFENAIDNAKSVREKAQAVGTSSTPADVAAAASALSEETSAFSALYKEQVGSKVVALDDDATTVQVAVPEQKFTGEALRPEPVVTVDGAVLTYRVDYKLAYSNNIEPGTASITVIGMDDAYTGSAAATFEIEPADIAGVEVAAIADVAYAPGGAVPEVAAIFNDGKIALVEGRDFELSFSGNDSVGTASATLRAIEGAGKRFTGAKTVSFNVVKGENPVRATAASASAHATFNPSAMQVIPASGVVSAEGAAGTVRFVKASGPASIGVNSDGSVRVMEGTPAGSYAIEIGAVASGDDYYEAGESIVEVAVVVVPASIAGAKVALSAKSFTENGKVQAPRVKSVTLGGAALTAADYTVSAPESKAPGSYKVTVAGKGNYTGKATASYKIAALKANPMTVKAKPVKLKAAALKKAASVKAISVAKAKGAVTFKKTGGAKQLSVNAKTGKVAVKAKTKAGAYKAKVAVTAAGNGTFAASTKTVIVKITVR